ncbi:coenzyme PQQ peptide PqqA [Pseudomonas aeruginosa]|nr:Hypothetical protein SCV20265_3407 [Pseudomonas aeruginosa SCV20265]AVJ89769.1 coenzyme PQQ peptide PqqA [Pseudomonas aeruginosa]EYU02630.1 hypothetical protein PA99_1373 [Pseudomonas aeruginosa PA99]CCQ85455.1 Coenzyme PQQ synthesis protein A [Pseudomonas aeruginosa 18A]AVK24949.1 coenzyme PQQ peptide PqqA [Pseudomonas aeruginosa]
MAGSGATRPWPRLFFRLAAAPAWTRLLPCTRANQGAQRRSPGEPWAGQAVPTKSGGKLLRKSHSERAPLMFNSTCRNRPAPPERIDPMWTKPSFTDLRLGFEVTLYFANR